jgi:hypothetical protein
MESDLKTLSLNVQLTYSNSIYVTYYWVVFYERLFEWTGIAIYIDVVSDTSLIRERVSNLRIQLSSMDMYLIHLCISHSHAHMTSRFNQSWTQNCIKTDRRPRLRSLKSRTINPKIVIYDDFANSTKTVRKWVTDAILYVSIQIASTSGFEYIFINRVLDLIGYPAISTGNHRTSLLNHNTVISIKFKY